MEDLAPVVRTVPARTALTFRIDEPISTESHGPGDRFTMTLASSVLDAEGAVVIAEGTPGAWTVTESTTEDGLALLAIALEAVRVEGEWLSVAASVTRATLGTDGVDPSASVAVGAAAGALIAVSLGGEAEPVLADSVAAAVQTTVAVISRGRSAVLPAGSTVVLRLEEPLLIS